MCKNQPFLTEEYKIVETKEKYPKFYIKDKKGKPLKNRVMGFSDGEHIYINASRYSYQSHFVRSKQIGRYLYFEDRFADPMAGVMFGLVGSALSNNPRAVILDTTTGLVILLDSIKMENFLDDHPNIKGEYMTSRKKIQDKYAAIEKVNEKFK